MPTRVVLKAGVAGRSAHRALLDNHVTVLVAGRAVQRRSSFQRLHKGLPFHVDPVRILRNSVPPSCFGFVSSLRPFPPWGGAYPRRRPRHAPAQHHVQRPSLSEWAKSLVLGVEADTKWS